MVKGTDNKILFGFMMGLVILGVVTAISGFYWMLKQSKESKSDKTEQFAVQSLITMECTSISGTTKVFSLREFPNPLQNPSYYAAIDNHGVVVVINSENYGQWKCEE